MRRSRIVAAGLAVALLCAGYAAWWLNAAEELRKGVFAWAEARRAEGWQVALDDVSVRGFPLRLAATAERFSVGRDLPLAWRWSGPRLTAAAPPWIGHELSLDAPGAHAIEVDTPDGRKTIPFTAAEARGTVRAGADGRIDRIDAVFRAVAAEVPDLGTVTAAQLGLALAARGAAAPDPNSPSAPEAGRLALLGDTIELPPEAAPTLGARINRVEAEIVLRGAIPAGHSRAALDAWREAGGTVELKKLRLHWGEFQAEAEGTAALDSELQPIGALTTRLWGVGSAIDALVAAGSMRPREGATAKVVLHIMAKPQRAPGIPPEVEVPLAVQERRLYLGPVAIAPLPRIDWP